ncbi:ATP-binding cassette sub-family G member 2-like, partial [Astatotilapia calliptera]|uniref:ATP-binding cassette sub-family G member 2-like n=1 Tax=Astatotilapia calliptera TaxID=8154 RepID=UPI000E414C74
LLKHFSCETHIYRFTADNIFVALSLSGIMKPGLNAIMGATGSGKSSFLDVLAARKDPAGLSGEVLIDGAPQPPNFKCLSGYVVQDDVVMGTLTVRENFTFSAALRLPSSISHKEKKQKVDRLIKELGLGRVADSKVGTQLIRGISGGERKRTNIGMELIIDPPVLFLDEPTTGLDASTANSVLLLLKRMANNGRTIILSIHQPRYTIYRLFDSLTLLVNGHQVYHGPARSALEYFSGIGYICEPHNNPADFFLDVINGDSTAVVLNSGKTEDPDQELDSESMSKSRRGIGEKLVEEYRNCQHFKETKAELERIVQGKKVVTTTPFRTITYTTGFLTQFRWVLKRTFRNLILNPQTSIAQVSLCKVHFIYIDATVIDFMDDKTLSDYIPTYGDRIAARRFCLENSGAMALIFGENQVSDDLLFESLLFYLSQSDRDLITRALKEDLSDEDRDEVLDLMDRLDLVVGALFFNVQNDSSGIQNRTGALFFIVVNQCFSSLSAAELFIAERKIFIHEYISGYYRVSVYFLCKILSDIITLRTIPAIVFTCVAYFMVGLKPTAGAFFFFMLTVALCAYTATSMAFAISADQTVVAIANIFMTITCVFMMIFAGLLVNIPSIASWLAWLKYLSIPRYGLSALQANEFTGLTFCEKMNTTLNQQ